MYTSGYLPFPDGLYNFVMSKRLLPRHAVEGVNRKGFYFELFSTADGPEYQSYFRNDLGSSMTRYQRLFLDFITRFKEIFPSIGVYYCQTEDNPDMVYVCYLLITRVGCAFGFLLNFNNRFDSIAPMVEEEYAHNFAQRLSPTLYEMCVGSVKLMQFTAIESNPFFLVPGISFVICPLGEDYEKLPVDFWNEISYNRLNNILQRYLNPVLDAVFREGPALQTTMTKFAFVNSGDPNFFGAHVMENFLVDPDSLPFEMRQQLLRYGYVDRTFNYSNRQLSRNEINGYEEIQERIQVNETFDPRDSQVMAFATYDIAWPDGTHSWACKIPINMRALLEKYDFSELDSKIPNISKAYSNSLVSDYKEGAAVETANGELVYFIDYDNYSKARENTIHLKGVKWLKQTMMELLKFNHHLKIKAEREGNRSTQKLGDTIKRGLIYRLLDYILS